MPLTLTAVALLLLFSTSAAWAAAALVGLAYGIWPANQTLDAQQVVPAATAAAGPPSIPQRLLLDITAVG